MMNGFLVVLCALFSFCFLGRKQYKHHWISIIAIVLGVAAVGLVGVMQAEEEHEEKQTTPFGVLTLLAALSFYAI